MVFHYKFNLIIVLILLHLRAVSQVSAVTEHGDSIFVYDNGTWSFELLEEMPEMVENELSYLSETIVLDTIETEFSVLTNSNKQVKNGNDMFVIKYDDSLWKRVPPATLNEEAEFAFQSKKTDIWSAVIAEETSIRVDKLFLIAKYNMKEHTGAEPKVIKTELRTVNGTQLIRGVMQS